MKRLLPSHPLPEGTVVPIHAPDEKAGVLLPPDLRRELCDALDEADLEEGGAGVEFLNGLKRFG